MKDRVLVEIGLDYITIMRIYCRNKTIIGDRLLLGFELRHHYYREQTLEQVNLVYNIEYYNSKLGSGCNLSKEILSKSKGDKQLVKHQDTEVYLQLYISKDYEKQVKYP